MEILQYIVIWLAFVVFLIFIFKRNFTLFRLAWSH